MATETFEDIRRRFLIEELIVAPAPPPGRDALALPDADGAPLAFVSWKAPTPGRAVLKAALLPLVR